MPVLVVQRPLDRLPVGKPHLPLVLVMEGGPHDQMKSHHLKENLDSSTQSLLKAVHSFLLHGNSSLANSCWICLPLGTPMPLALPAPANYSSNGTLRLPFPVQPIGSACVNVTCYQKPPVNNSYDLDVGSVTESCNCSSFKNSSTALFALPGQSFVCGNNLAFSYLPQNWTGICMVASLFPDASIVPGDNPVPLPSFDSVIGRRKRAIQFIPLLATLGITAAVSTGTAGLGYSLQTYQQLSRQLINDVDLLTSTIQVVQDQLDSLAEVVLQNRRGLDLLTAEKGGLCLALNEQCCFYANRSGIVRDKIKTLQEDLAKRRKALQDNPLWSGLNGLLPYLLPLLGPVLGLCLILFFLPCLFQFFQRRFQELTRVTIHQMMLQPMPNLDRPEYRYTPLQTA
ncbi:envelope glycoprotein [Plecturocebus cupreus]